MLLNIILTAVLMVGIPLIAWFFFKQGYNIGAKEVGKPVITATPKPKKTRDSVKKEKRYEQILKNIESYDGTSAGQREVK